MAKKRASKTTAGSRRATATEMRLAEAIQDFEAFEGFETGGLPIEVLALLEEYATCDKPWVALSDTATISEHGRHDVAAAVARHADLEQRIESGIAKLGADLEPPMGYEDRVLDEVIERGKRFGWEDHELVAVTPHDPTGSPIDVALDAIEYEAQRAAEPDTQDDDGTACGNCVSPRRCEQGACSEEIPTRIVLDDATFDALTDAIENPRQPTEAMRRLMAGASHAGMDPLVIAVRDLADAAHRTGVPDMPPVEAWTGSAESGGGLTGVATDLVEDGFQLASEDSGVTGLLEHGMTELAPDDDGER